MKDEWRFIALAFDVKEGEGTYSVMSFYRIGDYYRRWRRLGYTYSDAQTWVDYLNSRHQ